MSRFTVDTLGADAVVAVGNAHTYRERADDLRNRVLSIADAALASRRLFGSRLDAPLTAQGA